MKEGLSAMKEKFQRVGQVMLIPISVITIASFLMGLGSAMTSLDVVKVLHLSGVIYKGSFLFDFFAVMQASGSMVFNNLAIFFAIGSAFGLANKEKGWAAFSGAIAFLAMHTIISTMFTIHGITPDTTTVEYFVKHGMTQIDAVRHASIYFTELGMYSYRLSIFGGLLIGIITSRLHNKLYNIKLPMALSFFAGTRTVPIVSLLAGSVVGFLLFYIWPPIGLGLSQLSLFIHKSGLLGTFIWACLDKSLLPFGLHHLITQPIRYTELGGSLMVGGKMYYGTTNIFMAQLADPHTHRLITRGFQSGRLILHFAGLPGAALAMYTTAPKENRKAVAGVLIPVVLTMVLFGVTEPIEFTFLFTAPWLFYLVHVPLTGLAFVLAEASHVSMFGGSVKDILPFLLQPGKLYVLPYLWLMPMFFIIYYFAFRFCILKFDLKTPGREGTIKLYSKADYNAKKAAEKGQDDKSHPNDASKNSDPLTDGLITAFGGADNLVVADNCMTRLRVKVKDADLVADDATFMNKLQAKGVVRQGHSFQIIYGTQVTMIAGDLREKLDLD